VKGEDLAGCGKTRLRPRSQRVEPKMAEKSFFRSLLVQLRKNDFSAIFGRASMSYHIVY